MGCSEASHLERGSLEGGERAREDRGDEPSGGERAQEEGIAALEGEAEWLAGGGEPLLQRGGDGRATAGRDDRVPAEVGDADARNRRGAAGGEDGDRLFLAQPLDDEIVGQLARQQAEGGVELVGGEEAEHVGSDALAQADLDAGVRLAEAGQQAGHVEVARRQQRSDPDAPAQDAAKLVHLLACAVHLGQDPPRASSDRLAGLGRADATACALEQRGAQLLLEPDDLVRQRRLRDVELVRGAREVAVPGHRLDRSKLPKLHPNDRRTRSLQ